MADKRDAMERKEKAEKKAKEGVRKIDTLIIKGE